MADSTPYATRSDAGRQLAGLLSGYRGERDVVVLALSNGGMPVAFEVARSLNVPLDVMLLGDLLMPGLGDLDLGAIASTSVEVLDSGRVLRSGIDQDEVREAVEERRAELMRHEEDLRNGRPRYERAGKTVILVDEGLASGSHARAAVKALRREAVARLVFAVPIAVPKEIPAIRDEVDELVCPRTDAAFAVGPWYDQAEEVGDSEVRDLLERAAEREPLPGQAG
ncbi:MAG TPA: phosphoribosyltransferase family protein [Candidatus Limnocylindria bacterium]|nr:phosphoribosyltransferase family protein [Candidatus Limnocylindria bacterium]